MRKKYKGIGEGGMGGLASNEITGGFLLHLSHLLSNVTANSEL